MDRTDDDHGAAGQRGGDVVRRILVLLAAATAGALALWLLGVSPAALVPRTGTGWLIVGGIGAALVVWSRLVVPRLVRGRAMRTALRVVPVLALVAVVLVPATVDRQVDETLLEGVPTAAPPSSAAAPTPAGGSTPPAPPSVEPVEPVRLSSGAVRGVGHVAEGEAAVWRSGDTAFVRLDLRDVQGAVDVVVWLVPGVDQTDPEGGIELGGLKGTRGTANYVVPGGVDVARYATVLLWCRAFSTPIAVAPQA
jgi:Electron transfer DM13